MDRFRTMYDYNDDVSYESRFWDTSNNIGEIHTFDTYKPRCHFKWMQDCVVPNWKSLIAKGRIINNPMLSCDCTIDTTLHHQHRVGVYKKVTTVEDNQRHVLPLPCGYPWTWDSMIPMIVENVLDSDLRVGERDYAITSAWSNVQVSEIQALASLGEMPETIRWIASLLSRAISILRAWNGKSLLKLVKYQFYSGKDSIDTVSDLWLELRYALRPLVFEMHQAVTALQTTVKRGSRQTARGYNRVQPVSTTYETKTLGFSTVGIRTTIVRRSNYRAGVLYTIDEDINGILALWGFDQPLESIWELTPFSFIIDWFFNVGDIISSWSYNVSLLPLTSWITEHHEDICRVEALNAVYASPADYVWSIRETPTFGSFQQVVTTKRRLTNPSRSYYPTCKIKLDLAKITDLAFIGRQLLNGIFRGKKRTLRV